MPSSFFETGMNSINIFLFYFALNCTDLHPCDWLPITACIAICTLALLSLADSRSKNSIVKAWTPVTWRLRTWTLFHAMHFLDPLPLVRAADVAQNV